MATEKIRIAAIESLLRDIDTLEEVTLNKLQTLREMRKTLQAEKYRLILNGEKNSPAKPVAPVQMDIPLREPVVSGAIPLRGHTLSHHIYWWLESNPRGEFSTRSLATELHRTTRYKNQSFKQLRVQVQTAVKYMRSKSKRWPHLGWNEDPRPGGGRMFTYRWIP